MPVNTSRWMIWLALVVLLPLPMLAGDPQAIVPVGRVIHLALRSLLGIGDVAMLSLPLFLLVCVYAALLWLPAWFYGRITADWQMKIRGSTAGLMVFCLLIGFSTFSVYCDLQRDCQPVTFFAIYN